MYTRIQQKTTRITSGRIPSVKILVQTQLLWFVLQAYTVLNGHMHAFDNHHQQHQICGLQQQKQQFVIWYNNKTTLTVQECCCNPGSLLGDMFTGCHMSTDVRKHPPIQSQSQKNLCSKTTAINHLPNHVKIGIMRGNYLTQHNAADMGSYQSLNQHMLLQYSPQVWDAKKS